MPLRAKDTRAGKQTPRNGTGGGMAEHASRSGRPDACAGPAGEGRWRDKAASGPGVLPGEASETIGAEATNFF